MSTDRIIRICYAASIGGLSVAALDGSLWGLILGPAIIIVSNAIGAILGDD